MQKVWLAIFGAMFVVPEVLWGPVENFIYSLFNPTLYGYAQILRNNFLFDYKYEDLLKLVLFVQLIGVIFFFFGWLRSKKNIDSKLMFWIILATSSLLCAITAFAFYLGVIFSISF